jgi:sialate O-acetylesterase
MTEKYDWWPNNPGTTYNSMIAPVIPYGIAGAIWYQGESNRSNYQVYALLKKTLIENWRADFKKDFPFYFVQIAPYTYGIDGKAELVREQQELVTKTVPKTGMVVVSDLVDNVKDIHPKNKFDVGKRLAGYALTETYQQNVGEYKSPFYESMKIEKDKIRVSFSNASAGLKCTGKTPLKFMIAGDDKKFVEATAKIEGSTVVVSSKLVKVPAAVRFCFDDTSMPDVFNMVGLPMAPFRTDNW